MRDFIDIGSSPLAEDCAQVGQPDYQYKARKELRAFSHQLKRCFPALQNENCGVTLKIKSNPHDFGTYHELVAYFDDENEKATQLAYDLEGECPEYWDDEAKKELENN